MFPVRVSIETVRAQHCLSCAHDGNIMMETYAVVSGNTVLNQLVETVLSALGYPQLAVHARGLIQVNKWKALPFDAITDTLDETVESLFRDISSHITLRILTKPAQGDSTLSQCNNDVKSRLLKLVCNRENNLLANIESQHTKDLISQLIICDEATTLDTEQLATVNEWLDQIENQDCNGRKSPSSIIKFASPLEVSKLESWFKNDPHPSRQKLSNLANILNSHPYRKSTMKITPQQVGDWFLMQRQKTKNSSPQPPISMAPPASFSAHSVVPVSFANVSTMANGTNGSVPISMMPDFRGKLEPTSQSTEKLMDEIRVDSESPIPPDEHHSAHSSETGNVDDEVLKQESTASSPDLSAFTSNSPKPLGLTNHTNGLSNHISNDIASFGAINNLTSMQTMIAAQQTQQHHLYAASQVPTQLPPTSGSNTPAPQHQVARSRLMFDPLTELPVLERWFEENPHPTWMQIDTYTNTLNACPYRENYPPISQHNVKIWFKNRRAKNKRMQSGLNDTKNIMEKLFPPA